MHFAVSECTGIAQLDTAVGVEYKYGIVSMNEIVLHFLLYNAFS